MVFRPKYLSVFMPARRWRTGTTGSPSARSAPHRQLPTKYYRARVAANGLTQRPFCIFGHMPERSITMRKYTLASPAARDTVDLRDYRQTIETAVHAVMPTASVQVEAGCYYVSPTPSQGDAVRIGRLICQSELKEHCIQIPKLFSSINLGGSTSNERKSKRNGGHH